MITIEYSVCRKASWRRLRLVTPRTWVCPHCQTTLSLNYWRRTIVLSLLFIAYVVGLFVWGMVLSVPLGIVEILVCSAALSVFAALLADRCRPTYGPGFCRGCGYRLDAGLEPGEPMPRACPRCGLGVKVYCRSCGYDLEGHTGEKCPECGRSVETEAVVNAR